MSEAVSRIEPVPVKPLGKDGVTVALAPSVARFSLRGNASDLATFTQVLLPTLIGDVAEQDGDLAIMLGPDEWLWIGAVSGNGAGQPVSITEVSDRQVGFDVTGPRAAELLMSGCPLDLERMAVGRGTRTIYETVEIVVIKRAADAFRVEVWRSFAPWLWAALAQA